MCSECYTCETCGERVSTNSHNCRMPKPNGQCHWDHGWGGLCTDPAVAPNEIFCAKHGGKDVVKQLSTIKSGGIPTPKELSALRLAAAAADIQLLKQEVIKHLTAGNKGGFSLAKHLNPLAQDEVKKMLLAAGWTVVSYGDQREGDFWTIKEQGI